MAKRTPAKTSKAKEKTVEWRGLTLTLPETPPQSFLFDLVDLDAEGENGFILLRMLRSFLGPDQFSDVRSQVVVDNAVEADSVGDLIDAVFDTYGMNAGESEASQGS